MLNVFESPSKTCSMLLQQFMLKAVQYTTLHDIHF